MFARGTHASQPHIPIVCSLSPNDKNLHAEMNELSQKRGRDAHLNWAVETSRATLLGLGRL